MEESRPVAGVDYPATYQQFDEWFRSEEQCAAFLESLRWPHGFVCPRCDTSGPAWRTAKGLLMCRACGHQASVRAGTILHRSRYPLKVWFAAMWFVCAQKNGVSALSLQRQFGFGSYETAWTWMHKLRRAMVVPGRYLLGGPGVTVEVDQSFVGDKKRSGQGRYENKAEVAIAVERQHPVGYGRVRLAHIDTSNRKSELKEFVRTNLAHGTIMVSDGDTIYAAIASELQFTHTPIAMIHQSGPAHQYLPAVHQVASLMKRWLAGTMHHGQSPDHLGYYLDEFTFRFNRRTSNSRGLLWFRLVQQVLGTDPHPLHDLRTSHSTCTT